MKKSYTHKILSNRKAIFLDRDGTINYDYGYVHKFSNFKFRPHVLQGLQYLSKKKYLIFIVTNQAGIGKGIFKISDLKIIHKKLLSFLLKKKLLLMRFNIALIIQRPK